MLIRTAADEEVFSIDDDPTGKSDEDPYIGDFLSLHLWLFPEMARATAVLIMEKISGTYAAADQAKLGANLKFWRSWSRLSR